MSRLFLMYYLYSSVSYFFPFQAPPQHPPNIPRPILRPQPPISAASMFNPVPMTDMASFSAPPPLSVTSPPVSNGIQAGDNVINDFLRYCRRDKISLVVSGFTYHVGYTSSHSNTEVKQHWAWIILGWETLQGISWHISPPYSFRLGR